MKNREPDGGVTVKEEVMQGGKEEEEEEEVNVDDQIGQEEHDEAKREEQKLKTEVDIETTSNKMESWLSLVNITFRSELGLIDY